MRAASRPLEAGGKSPFVHPPHNDGVLGGMVLQPRTTACLPGGGGLLDVGMIVKGEGGRWHALGSRSMLSIQPVGLHLSFALRRKME